MKKGSKMSAESRKKLSISHMGLPGAVGSKRTPEQRARMSASAKRRKSRPQSEACKAKITATLMGHSVSDETRRKIGESGIGRVVSKETRRKISESHKGMNTWMKGRVTSPEIKAKISATLKGRVMKREWVEKMLLSRRKGLLRLTLALQPNKLETSVQQYLDSNFPNQWKFNDGEFLISGFYPDFVNVNGQKAVIEVFGDYWHRGENPQRKISIYKKAGYECVVIWEREFKADPELLGNLVRTKFFKDDEPEALSLD